ncbi:MAG: hypothetical protein ABI763_01685, partial [Bacteroidota bacterium]
MTKSPALGYPPSETMQAIRNSLNQPQSLISSCPNDWTERGPGNVGGRTRAIMFDPNDGGNGFKKVWACGVAGGLWYRDDITVASSSNPWTHVSDFWDNLAITALTFDPNNIQNFYVGTGEGWFNSDAVRGGGIWFSDQAGNAGTWNQIPWSDPSDATYGGDFLYIQKIVVYNGYAYVATLSGLWQFPVPANSVPTKVLGAGTGYGIDRIADIEIGASGNLFVSTGIRSTDGIYRRPSSTVGAGGWTKLNVGGSGLPTINFQRIELACAASNSQIAYAMVETTAPLDVKIYKTSNANATIPFWTQCGVPTWHNDEIPTTQSCVPVASDISRGHAFYDLIIQVDPLDENNVYMGAIDLFRSTNGGTIWNQISEWTRPGSGYNCGLPYVHADQHNIQFRPGQTGASSNQILFSNDGGVYYTTNGGTGFLEENYNYNVTQLYSCALNPAGSVVGANPNNFLAGTQDNGSQWFNAAGIDFSTDMVNGGDGALCFIDQEQPDYQIVSYLLDNFYRSSNGTTTHTFGTMYWNDFHDNVGCNLVNGYNTLWIDPADYDTRNNTLFFGSGLGDGSPCGLCLLDVGYSDDV